VAHALNKVHDLRQLRGALPLGGVEVVGVDFEGGEDRAALHGGDEVLLLVLLLLVVLGVRVAREHVDVEAELELGDGLGGLKEHDAVVVDGLLGLLVGLEDHLTKGLDAAEALGGLEKQFVGGVRIEVGGRAVDVLHELLGR